MNLDIARTIHANWQVNAMYFPRRFRRMHRLLFEHPGFCMYRALLSCGHLVTIPQEFFLQNGKPRNILQCSKCFARDVPMATVCDFCRQIHDKKITCSRPSLDG